MKQYLQIFRYLKAFAKLRNHPIKDIDSSKQYECLWLDTIPNNNDFYNVIKASDKKGYWLKLRKPKKPQEPIEPQIQTPKKLIDWIENLYDENAEPIIKVEINNNKETLFLDDKPEIRKELEEYIRHQWMSDILQYKKLKQKHQQQKEEYDKQEIEYKKLFQIYQSFFKFYEKLENNTENLELIVAVGLFNYQLSDNPDEPKSKKRYCRHLIIQIANINYNNATITVSISGENPEVEDEFITGQFDDNSIKQAKEIFEQVIIDEKADYIDLLNIDSENNIIKDFADKIGAEQYYHQTPKPEIAYHKSVYYAPALILRKKNTSKLSKAYDEVIINLENRESQSTKIELIDEMVNKQRADQCRERTDLSGTTSQVSNNTTSPLETIYFPHPANDEQLKILNKIKYNNAVVVQGPPGTGKSHTIANLICHLLATGNKVLITAYTKRALQVLKDKLPDEYKSLVVNYWGTDKASKDDLNNSVDAIKNKSDDFTYIDKTSELDEINRSIAKNTNKYNEIIRQNTKIVDPSYQEINISKYQGTFGEVLEKLEADKQEFNWYKDEYDNYYCDKDLENQLNKFIEFNKAYPSLDFNSFFGINELPTTEELDQYDKLIEKLGFLYSAANDKHDKLLECDIKNIECLINELPGEALDGLDNITISYPNENINLIKNHAETLIKHLKNGNRLEGINFNLKRSLLPKEIKEKLYLIKAIKIDGSDCYTIERFEQVIKDIEVKQIFAKLKDIYNTDLKNEHKKNLSFYQDVCSLYKLKQNKHIATLHVKCKKPGWREDYKAEYSHTDKKNQFKEVRQQLSKKIPNTIEQILFGSKITFKDLQGAYDFKCANDYVQQRLSTENISDLEKNIKRNKEQAQELITEIGVNKSWAHTVDKLKDRVLKKELDYWAEAVNNIGKTESKQRWRKIAKEQMQKCKNIIPCWIMPLQQLADTVSPEQEMYDYIIVDEASQLGVDAMLLLYLAKKVIIVGDKKQTAPEYIGIKDSDIENLIDEHLQGIPQRDAYGIKRSFFDHAAFNFDKVTLREHFRCMPEIIDFSNKLCYAENSLHPLRTYSEKRLTPLKHTFCNEGYTDGVSSAIHNKPEALAIVKSISEVLQDKQYKGKTIGVIILQGNAQQDVIHKLLLEKIDNKDYQERKIMVGNAAAFQGDERDVVFLSLVTAYNHNRRSLTGENDERRFNVAASRAKDQLWLFHSVQLSDLSNHEDLRYKLLNHVINHKTPEFAQRQLVSVPNPKPKYGDEPKAPKPFRSWFEVEVHNDIINQGYKVAPAYKVAGYEIDLVVFCADGTKIAVECDGDYWHSDEQYNNDRQRQEILERAGWQFFRILYSDYVKHQEQATAKLWDELSKLSKPVETITNEQEKVQPQDKYTQEKQVENIEPEQLPVEQSKSRINEVQARLLRGALGVCEQSENEITETLLFLNFYQSGNYIVSKDKKEDADFSLTIDNKYKNGYLLQCYNNGHINKFDVSSLLSRKLDKEYQNGFNVKTNNKIPQLLLLKQDEIIGITFTEAGERKFKAHLTENLPTKDNLSIQGYKVIYNKNYTNVKYQVIPVANYDDIKRIVFKSFNADGKNIDNKYYEKEWQCLGKLDNVGI